MMEHRAFRFDYGSFEWELRPTLEEALSTRDTSRLEAFIVANLECLRDPDEGERLDGDWASLIETKDAHQYGDVALTKYYSPTADIGLGDAWERVQDVTAAARLAESPILGSTIGPPMNPFDPGKMGSYFQSATSVRDSYERMAKLAKAAPSADLDRATKMLEEAARSNAGLYVTF